MISIVFLFAALTAQEAPAEAPKADENQPAAAAEQPAQPAEAPAAEAPAQPAEQPAQPAETPAEQPAQPAEAPAEQPAEQPAQPAEAPAEQPAEQPAQPAEAPAEAPAETPAETPAEEAPAADATAEAPADNCNCPACDAPAEEAPVADPHHFIYFKPQLSASYMHNRAVAGKADGHYFQTDANILFNYKYKESIHEVLTDLNWKEGVSYTPAFDGWVIANDLFKVDFRYNLMFHKIAGYYLKAGLETHFLPGYDYRADDTDYVDATEIAQEDSGEVDENGEKIMQTKRLDSGKRKFKLAKSGKPLYLTEGTGIFVRPVEREEANLEIYAGLAGREVWVGGTWAVDAYDDDVATLKKLNNVYEVGAEAGLTLKGYLKDRIVAYDLMARVIKPFYMPDDTKINYSKIAEIKENGDVVYEYSELDSLQFETRFRLDLNLHKYVAFNYEINVKRDYAMVRKWQVSNALYLSVFYELDKKLN